MRYATLIYLYLIGSLSAYAQVGTNPKAPSAAGLINLGYDAATGALIQRGKIGPSSYVKVDPAASNLTAYKPMSAIRSMTSPAASSPLVMDLTDRLIGGSFGLVSGDATSADDGAMTLVTQSGLRYKRIYSGAVDVRWFGAVGDDLDASASKNTAALNAAIAYVSASGNAALGSNPVQLERPATLYIPAGSYKVNAPLLIPGTIRITGDGGLSYGGTLLYQISSNQHLFSITGSADAGNCALQLENVRLRGQGSGTPTASLVYLDEAVASANSLYFNRVWFQGWERFALQFVGKTDDLQITNCTFDGATNYALGIGGNADHPASNVKVTGNTFYGIEGGLAYLGNVDGFSFSGNDVYGGSQQHPGTNTGFGIDALNVGYPVKRLRIVNNTFDRVEYVFQTRWDGWEFSFNTVTNTNSAVVVLGGGGVVRYGKGTNNQISGNWTKTYQLNGETVYDAPIYAGGTGVYGTILKDNIITGPQNSRMAVNLPDSRTHGCKIDNIIDGFTTPNLVANSGENLRGSQPVYTNSYNVSSWSAGSYYSIIPANLLVDGSSYLVELYYNQAGLDVLAASYVLPIVTSYTSAAPQPITGQTVNYSGNQSRKFSLRYAPPGADNTTLGVQASPSEPLSSTLAVKVIRLD